MTGVECTVDIATVGAQPTPLRPVQGLRSKAPNSRQPALANAICTPYVGEELGPWFALLLKTVTHISLLQFRPTCKVGHGYRASCPSPSSDPALLPPTEN